MAVDLISQRTPSEDSIFGDMDCNDNTPVLQPQTLQPSTKVSYFLRSIQLQTCHNFVGEIRIFQ